jgi:hypothetical protein
MVSMRSICKVSRLIFVARLFVLGASGFAAPAFGSPLDENITVSFTALGTSINWQTAGALQPQSSGSLGPFKKACAILQGTPSTTGSVMKRSVYVLDAGNGASNSVVLHIYTRTDTITSNNGQISDVATIVPHHKVVLSLASAAASTCYMAANDTSVFASSSANDMASIVDKTTFVETIIQSSVTATTNPVAQISATMEGIVFVTFGTGPTSGFAEFDDSSNFLAAGQNFNFTVLADTVNATTF